MAKSERNLTAIFTDTANAIRSKTGGSSQINPRDFADEIVAIPTGSQEIVPGPNDNVIVYDYDGTVLDAKQVAVGAEYTLPEAPTHDGLTFDGWTSNADISNGKITIPATKDVRVGALYYTTSGKLEIDIHAPKNIEISVYSSWTNVDWGDGTITTSSNAHTYAAEGDYTIKILTNLSSVLPDNLAQFISNKYLVRRVKFPQSITVVGRVFTYCYSLEAVAFHSSFTSITGSFQNVYSMKHINIPSSCSYLSLASTLSLKTLVLPNRSSFSELTLSGDYAIKEIILPLSLTTVPYGTCQSLQQITKVKFPKSITSIASSSFQSCSGCGVFDFSTHETIPTIQSNSFSSINANAKIIVPDALYNDWIAASNWSDLASRIVKASEA